MWICSSIAFTLWVFLDTGHLTHNAKCIKRGMKVDSNDIMLLFVTNNCWTRSFTLLGYWLFISLVLLTQMRTKIFVGKILSQVSMHVAFLPSSILWTVNLWPLVVVLCYTKLLLDQLWWGTWTCIIFTIKSVLTYEVTHLTYSRESLWPA